MPPAFLLAMRFFIQILLNLVNGFRYRAIAPLFTQTFQTGENSIYKQLLFRLDACHVILVVLPDFLNILVLSTLLVNPSNHFGEVCNKRDNRANDRRCRDDGLPS